MGKNQSCDIQTKIRNFEVKKLKSKKLVQSKYISIIKIFFISFTFQIYFVFHF